jgi:flavin reductase (DIM6/NTAB) family NADH-FMN oxidoreductase RutF
LLQGAVAPRPIAWASTVDAQGQANLAPFSFFNLFSAAPPVVVFSPARSGRTGAHKHTLLNARETGEVVINVVPFALVEQASLSSVEYPQGVSEFTKAGLTAFASETVRPARVAESPVQMECRVRQILELSDAPGAGNLIICDITRLHIREDVLDADGKIDPRKIDLVARMGGDWYTRAREGLFVVPKPVRTQGVGVDALPEAVRQSPILTGNDLGRLGNVEALPTLEALDQYRALMPPLPPATDGFAAHRYAQALLADGKVAEAWLALLA